MNETKPRRVDRFVEMLQDTDSAMCEDLADVFQHYIDNVEAINNGTFEIDSIPHFSESAKAVIHGGVMFGITWGKESELSVITKNTGEYVAVYGSRETAEDDIDTDTHSIQDVVPEGRDVEDEFQSMRSGETELLQELGAAVEYLHGKYDGETSESITEIDHQVVLTDVPHLDTETSTVLLFSMLFGRQWEFSDPALWVVTVDDEFDSLHGWHQSATKRESYDESYTAEAITPVDNDRNEDTMNVSDVINE